MGAIRDISVCRDDFHAQLKVLDNATNKKYDLIGNKEKIWEKFVFAAKKLIAEKPIDPLGNKTEEYDDFTVFLEFYDLDYKEVYDYEPEYIYMYNCLTLVIEYARYKDNESLWFWRMYLKPTYIEEPYEPPYELPQIIDEMYSMSLMRNAPSFFNSIKI